MTERFVTATASYVTTAQLRGGAAGGTYVVRREADGAEFVLKRLVIGRIDDWKQFDLFEREVAALKSIAHPRVPSFVDSHLDEGAGTFVLVQTLIRGTSLRQLMVEKGSLSAAETDNYVRQCLAILDDLHTRSPPIIHRDITPSNIMLADGQVYLVDFGAVKIGRGESTSLTTVGTFGYMAPEQILGRAEVRSDLYGLGMTFIALHTGRDPSDLPQDPNTGQIDPWRLLSVPIPLGRALLAMIKPGLNERPASARAALAMLDQPEALQPVAPAWPVMRPYIDHAVLASPYEAPDALSERDKGYMRAHSLRQFPVWGAVLLHYLTFGLFSVIHYGAQHDRMPKAMTSDPSAAKAIGFSFIPYFNIYWGVWNPLRLADRINLQHRIRNRPDAVSRGLILACGILGVIPYINILFGIPFWGVGVYKLQKAINALAIESEQERRALPQRAGDHIPGQ
jgi:serine/threonine protein kinase